MNPLIVSNRPIRSLQSHPHNPRTHSEKQIGQLMASIRSFGFNNPVLFDKEDSIIAGHGRVEAAKRLGMTEVPAVRLEHLSEAQKRAYVIADNRLAELAGWDRELLAAELGQLLEIDLEFEVTDIGFEPAEIDLLLATEGEQADPEDDVPEPATGEPVTKAGDLWIVGPHRILCGNALEEASYDRVMMAERAQMVFTHPPYNVPIAGHVSGLGKARHAEFAMASGEMSEAEFTRFLTAVFRLLVRVSADGSIHYICMDWRHLSELLRAGRIVYSQLKNLCVWTKSNGGMGSLYRSQHELVAVFKSGTAPHVNNVALGSHGRNRTNVWSYPGLNSFQAGRDNKLAMHPTVKPVALVADAMLDCSPRGGIVLDPLLGSGSTVIAGHRVGRRCFGIEIDPRYVDVTLLRVMRATGLTAVHAKTGEPFPYQSLQGLAPVPAS